MTETNKIVEIVFMIKTKSKALYYLLRTQPETEFQKDFEQYKPPSVSLPKGGGQ